MHHLDAENRHHSVAQESDDLLGVVSTERLVCKTSSVNDAKNLVVPNNHLLVAQESVL